VYEKCVVFLWRIGPSSARQALVDQPWFIVTLIVCIGSALWLAMCVAIVWIIRYRRRRKLLANNKYVIAQKQPGRALFNMSITYTSRYYVALPREAASVMLSVRPFVRPPVLSVPLTITEILSVKKKKKKKYHFA